MNIWFDIKQNLIELKSTTMYYIILNKLKKIILNKDNL